MTLLFALARRIVIGPRHEMGAAAMQGWQTSYPGLRDLPRELSGFELQAFFSFGRDELEVIARRRGDNHKLGHAA